MEIQIIMITEETSNIVDVFQSCCISAVMSLICSYFSSLNSILPDPSSCIVHNVQLHLAPIPYSQPLALVLYTTSNFI